MKIAIEASQLSYQFRTNYEGLNPAGTERGHRQRRIRKHSNGLLVMGIRSSEGGRVQGQVVVQFGVRKTGATIILELCDRANLPFQLFGLPRVVGVQESNPLSTRLRDSLIASSTLALIGLMEVPDFRASLLTAGSLIDKR